MPGNDLTADRVDGQLVVQAQAHGDRLAAVVRRHAVAVTSDVDVGVPAHVSLIVVAGIEVRRRQRLKGRSLLFPTLRRAGLVLSQHPPVEPLLQQPVEMAVALEVPVALEEVLFHIAHHPLGLALGTRPLGPTRLGLEAVMVGVGQIQEAGVEMHGAVPIMPDHGRLLIVHQDLARHAAEVVEGPDQPFIGVFGVFPGSGPDVQIARGAEYVHDKMDRAGLTGQVGPDLAPIVLKLLPGFRLIANGLLARAKSALGLDVQPDQGAATGVTLVPELLIDHLGVPDLLSDLLVNKRLEGVQLTGATWAAGVMRCWQRQISPYRSLRTAQLMRDVHDVSALFSTLLYHEKVLSA